MVSSQYLINFKLSKDKLTFLTRNLGTHFHLVAAFLGRRLSLSLAATSNYHLYWFVGIPSSILPLSKFLGLYLLRGIFVFPELNKLLNGLASLVI